MKEKEEKWSEEMEKLKSIHKEEMDGLQLEIEERFHVQKQVGQGNFLIGCLLK